MNGQMADDVARDTLRVAGNGIEVAPAPIDHVIRRAHAERSRRRRAVAAAVAVVLAVAGIGTWAGTRTGPRGDPVQPPVTKVANPADLAWWADGVLHLDDVAVGLSGIDQVAEVGGGALVGDAAGRVRFVEGDGTTTTIGHRVVGAPLATSAGYGLAAWVEPRDGSPELVVYDVDDSRVVATRVLPSSGPNPEVLGAGSYPIAFAGRELYFAAADGDWAWPIEPRQDPIRIADSGFLGTGAARLSIPAPGRVEMVAGEGTGSRVVRGDDGQLSSGGRWVMVRRTGADPGDPFGTVAVYDVRTQTKVWTGLRPDDAPVAVSMGTGPVATYVVEKRGATSGPYELRTCRFLEHVCETVARIPRSDTLPLLPR